ncbi:hypothetical protein CVT25_005099 [Psilocybe cyanescens]|uniref:Major facilitator superfamily (MFS) profile domain-containing protein n=1 Tax=Psilocybe cyanescens TaxID=93625 RepID=A0A409XE16_PSICY|nr:hypothetical protein CVT25_005099 [Psilocybe cyanescens]
MSETKDFSSGNEKIITISENPLKLDSSGLPLIPQPTSSPFDPLNYPNWLKYAILAQVSFLAFLSTMNVAIINPAVILLADEFHIAPVTATYQTTVAIGTSGLGPLLFTPFANVYGRRPAYLLSVLIGFASAVGSAKATSFGTLIIARVINGVGSSAALGLGAGTVVDLFFEHHRGRTMGIFALMSTNGAHLAPIVGGYVAQARGWRWCFWVGAILNGAFFVISCIFMPETIFDRPEGNDTDENVLDNLKGTDEKIEEVPIVGELFKAPPMSLRTYIHRLWIWDLDRPPTRQIKSTDFLVKPLSMLKYPSVAFPALYYAVTYGFASIEPALTIATLFTQIYHFDTVRNGLANGVSLLVGATLGELCSGPVTDAMMARARRQALTRGETAPPEVRLQGIWTGAVTVPAGLLISSPPSVIPTAAAIAIVREATTFFRQVFGLTLGFYSIPFGEKVCRILLGSDLAVQYPVFGTFYQQIGFEWSFTVFAGICIVSFLPIIALMYRGEKWRKYLGDPDSTE